MKKLAIVLLTALFSTTAFCGEPGESWVKTGDGQTPCEKVVVRKDHLSITSTDGKQEQIPLNKVTSYSKNGKVFIKQSIYTGIYQKGDRKSEVFMKLIASKDGMDLLKYSDNENGVREFVFNGTQLIQELNKINKKEFHEFFGV